MSPLLSIHFWFCRTYASTLWSTYNIISHHLLSCNCWYFRSWVFFFQNCSLIFEESSWRSLAFVLEVMLVKGVLIGGSCKCCQRIYLAIWVKKLKCIIIKFSMLIHLLFWQHKYFCKSTCVLRLMLISFSCLLNHECFSLLIGIFFPLSWYHSLLYLFVSPRFHILFPLIGYIQ